MLVIVCHQRSFRFHIYGNITPIFIFSICKVNNAEPDDVWCNFFVLAEMCILLRFIKIPTPSLLLNCSNRPLQPYRIADSVFELRLVYCPPRSAVISCMVYDPEFTGRICYLNSRLTISAQASDNCVNFSVVVITCDDKGTYDLIGNVYIVFEKITGQCVLCSVLLKGNISFIK